MIEVHDEKIDRKECLVLYQHYVENVRGLSNVTCRCYVLIARRFLQSLGRSRRINKSKINADAVIDFVRSDAAPRSGQGPNMTVSATRSFLRFLILEEIIPSGLDAAVPRVRCYRHAALPVSLSQVEIKQLLVACKDGSRIRNYAMILILSRLGLRIDEVARLSLDDFDWVNGSILIRAGKNRCERKLPLANDLAKSILQYLRRSRPKADDRHLFLHWHRPFKGYDGDALGKIIQRILRNAGLKRPSGGPHQFRHSAATTMVNRGASFKEIADLLGHQSLSTTGIYAKLDFESLNCIALPWAGVSHD